LKIAFFNTKPDDMKFFEQENKTFAHDIHYFTPHLTLESTALISDEKVVCAFINDCLDAEVLSALKQKGIELIALRSAGFNHVDLGTAKQLTIPVVRVPAYSPFAIAEHAVALLLCLNRGIHRAHNRIREGDFSLRNLMGFDLHGKTVGVIGTGKIGQVFIKIMQGFGCKVLAYDVSVSQKCVDAGVEYLTLNQLFEKSDIISLHCPLNADTFHLIDEKALAKMRHGITIINTSRGKLIDTKAAIRALKSGKIGLLGLDVYEEEEAVFFEDFSDAFIEDDVLARLMTFPNVIITSHQGFFTREAMLNIARTTLSNISHFENFGDVQNGVT
jgi:D-lactate dehydrogenase